MIENDDMIAPKEIVDYFKNFRCVICKSPLDDEPYCFRDLDGFKAYADCSEDCFHNEILIFWKDPKKIAIEHEEIKFQFENRFYTIKKIFKTNKTIENQICLTPIGPDGNEDQDLAREVSFTGKLFNFKKFTPEKFANRINILRVFS